MAAFSPPSAVPARAHPSTSESLTFQRIDELAKRESYGTKRLMVCATFSQVLTLATRRAKGPSPYYTRCGFHHHGAGAALERGRRLDKAKRLDKPGVAPASTRISATLGSDHAKKRALMSTAATDPCVPTTSPIHVAMDPAPAPISRQHMPARRPAARSARWDPGSKTDSSR